MLLSVSNGNSDHQATATTHFGKSHLVLFDYPSINNQSQICIVFFRDLWILCLISIDLFKHITLVSGFGTPANTFRYAISVNVYLTFIRIFLL